LDVFYYKLAWTYWGFSRSLTEIVRVYFPIWLTQFSVMLWEERDISSINTDTMAFSTPPSLRDTSPIANATPRNATRHSNGGV